jgi:hypothetical protein
MMVSRGVGWAEEIATMTNEIAADLRRNFFIKGSGMLNNVCLKAPLAPYGGTKQKVNKRSLREMEGFVKIALRQF